LSLVLLRRSFEEPDERLLGAVVDLEVALEVKEDLEMLVAEFFFKFCLVVDEGFIVEPSRDFLGRCFVSIVYFFSKRGIYLMMYERVVGLISIFDF